MIRWIMEDSMVGQPEFVEINLSLTTSKGGAGLEVGPTYLVLYRGAFHIGKFSEQWYGLNFRGIYQAGAQYDPPGENYSNWQRIWRITNAEDLSAEAEPEYKQRRRQYAIAYLTSNGQRIDESAPLDAFGYHPSCDPMPPKNQETEE
jgi:hypothetical protein